MTDSDKDKAYSQPVDTLVATLLYLMSRYARAPGSRLEQVIAQHLEYVSSHPDCQSGVLRQTTERLRQHWLQQRHGSDVRRDSSTVRPVWH